MPLHQQTTPDRYHTCTESLPVQLWATHRSCLGPGPKAAAAAANKTLWWLPTAGSALYTTSAMLEFPICPRIKFSRSQPPPSRVPHPLTCPINLYGLYPLHILLYSLSLSPVTHMAACGSSNQLSPPVLHCSPFLPLPYIFPIPSLLFSLSLPAGAFETLKVSNNQSGIISLFCFVSLMKSLFDLDDSSKS